MPSRRKARSSAGNHAFDEYRAETLRRLEEDPQEFTAFIERLHFAKDQAEFDQFMAERRPWTTRPPEADYLPTQVALTLYRTHLSNHAEPRHLDWRKFCMSCAPDRVTWPRA